MTTRIFIGSSTEGLKVAEYIQNKLNNDILNIDSSEKVLECILWNDGEVFEKNTSYLDSLLQAASMFDFGVLVATKDDAAVVRDEAFKTPRDNVIFEFGLFIGRLGSNRAFVLQEKEAKLPTDLKGISVAEFVSTDDLENSESLNKQIEVLKKDILAKIKVQELSLLASTSIAMGFYENYIAPLCDVLSVKKVVSFHKQKYNKFAIEVFIPSDLYPDMQKEAQTYYSDNHFEKITVKSLTGREIKTVCKVDEKDAERLIFCDMPTTLSALFKSIVLYLRIGHLGKNRNQNLLEARELNNFKLSLQAKLDENTFNKRTVRFIVGKAVENVEEKRISFSEDLINQ